MRFNSLYKSIIAEDNLAGDGSVFGPGSVSTGPDLQGDNIYNPGDHRLAKGLAPVVSRLGAVSRKKRKKKKK